jgi:CheY-like chemotaxis protein
MNNYKLLLIDDDKISLIINKQFLKKQEEHNGTDIEFFEDAEVGLKAVTNRLSDKTTPPLWILLDINMPNMNGWEFLDYLKNVNRDQRAKVIMMTSSVNEEDQIKAKAYPFVCDFLSKPMNAAKAKRVFTQIAANPTICRS